MDNIQGILLFLLAFLQVFINVQGLTSLQTEKKRVLDKLLERYDTKIRPAGWNGTDGPVVVKVNMFVIDVTSVSDYDMDFGLQVYFRQEWQDDRLKYDGKGNLTSLTLSDVSKVWTPDLFFLHEKDSEHHRLMALNSVMWISPSGYVLYSARLSLTLLCKMNLRRFPFDTQVCFMNIESYGQSTAELQLQWKDVDPLEISSSAYVMGFTIGKGTAYYKCPSTKTLLGEFGCLKAEFSFKRDLQYYLLHVFLPSCMLVVLSWSVFWLDPRASVVRVLLGLGTLLAAVSKSSDLEASEPHVPYVKAVDLWSGVVITFLFVALLESALVCCVLKPKKENKGDEERNGIHLKPMDNQTTGTNAPKSTEEGSQTSFYKGLLSQDPHRLDGTARKVFPPVYLAFVLLYFFFYLVM